MNSPSPQTVSLTNRLLASGIAGEYRDYIAAEQCVMGIGALVAAWNDAQPFDSDTTTIVRDSMNLLYESVANDEKFHPGRLRDRPHPAQNRPRQLTCGHPVSRAGSCGCRSACVSCEIPARRPGSRFADGNRTGAGGGLWLRDAARQGRRAASAQGCARSGPEDKARQPCRQLWLPVSLRLLRDPGAVVGVTVCGREQNRRGGRALASGCCATGTSRRKRTGMCS